jgi:hypothetical protein
MRVEKHSKIVAGALSIAAIATPSAAALDTHLNASRGAAQRAVARTAASGLPASYGFLPQRSLQTLSKLHARLDIRLP